MYFFLVQSEQGDIFKMTFETEDEAVSEIKLKYFDTVPTATAMCVLITGFLFVARDLANDDTAQLYLLCGRGPRLSLRVLRHGLEVSEMSVSELPGNSNAVWMVKKRADGKCAR